MADDGGGLWQVGVYSGLLLDQPVKDADVVRRVMAGLWPVFRPEVEAEDVEYGVWLVTLPAEVEDEIYAAGEIDRVWVDPSTDPLPTPYRFETELP